MGASAEEWRDDRSIQCKKEVKMKMNGMNKVLAVGIMALLISSTGAIAATLDSDDAAIVKDITTLGTCDDAPDLAGYEEFHEVVSDASPDVVKDVTKSDYIQTRGLHSYSDSDWLTPGQSWIRYTLDIGPGYERIESWLTHEDSDCDVLLRLVDPDDIVVDSDSGGWFSGTKRHVKHTSSELKQGTWKIDVIGEELDADGTQYDITIEWES